MKTPGMTDLDPAVCPVLTVQQVAAMPNMPSERSLREAIAQNKFPHRWIGRRVVIPTAELRRWLGLDADAA
jgi:hypothetical protein